MDIYMYIYIYIHIFHVPRVACIITNPSETPQPEAKENDLLKKVLNTFSE